MSVSRQGRLKRAAALVPLAMLSAAWTVSICTTGAPEASAGGTHQTLPDGTEIPGDAVQVPASVTAPGGGPLGVTGESTSQIVSTSSASSIPSTALAAYQRAETVINRADRSCHLPWQLLAAIGRVESDHGRADGNRVSTLGVSQPGVLGIALDGRDGTTKIADTDGGQYDGDTRFDRAVGPMQFIPSTWSTVGVDADGDGRRNPQDINDAALAAAVYLCSGDDDLSTAAGRSAAVYRYNHSKAYVATVLAVMQSYLDGDYTAAPDNTLGATYFFPAPAPTRHPGRTRHHAAHQHAPSGTSSAHASHSTAPSSTSSTGSQPHAPQASTPSAPDPTPPHVSVPTSAPSAVHEVMTLAQATAQCTIDLAVSSIPNPLHLSIPELLKPLGLLDDWNACLEKYTT